MLRAKISQAPRLLCNDTHIAAHRKLRTIGQDKLNVTLRQLPGIGSARLAKGWDGATTETSGTFSRRSFVSTGGVSGSVPITPTLQFEDGYRDSTQWLDVTLLSRLNNKRTGCIIIVMQRLHEDDLVGHVLPARRLDGALVPAIARRPPGGAALRS